jgi:hypothetical protein
MKKYKNKEILKKLQNDLTLHLETMNISISDCIKEMKKEHNLILINEKNKLLEKIAEGEKLDLNTLKSKYLKSKEYILSEEKSVPTIDESEELLDTITLDGITYYYENKERGIVYNMNNKEVGIFKDGNILIK